ncbi:hypothetical protein PR048_002990 [Dryococelus australis]|uniref:Uncharacterized protein n=1 Tax=Dryococelus australis TaxID=614101 RepID=A0ABQ9ILV0_9NEOP|nr:hypothetical protein PR048_002990 [Dryococelus australis]
MVITYVEVSNSLPFHRYLDKLMGTSFFHESHFQGLLERVRERGRANVAQRVADQVSRLFYDSNHDCRTALTVGDPGSAPEDSGLSSTELSTKDSNGSSGNESFTSGAFFVSENLVSLERRVTAAANQNKMDIDDVENTRTASAIPNGHGESPEAVKSPTSPPVVVSNSHVCVKLCSLIKAQLVKAHAEVTRRFGGHQGQMTLSEAFKTHSPVEETEEENTAPTTVLASSEDTGGQTQPLLEKVKDGIMDVFNVIVRLKTNTVPNGDEVVEEVKEDAPVSSTATSEELPVVREYGEGKFANFIIYKSYL